VNPGAFPRLPVTLALTAALNTVVALGLWLLVPAMGQFGSIFVYSQCVGLGITLCAIAIARLLLLRVGLPSDKHPARRPLLRRSLPLFLAAMLVPAAPLGYLIGQFTARALLGREVTLLGPGPVATGAVLATVLATALAGYVLWSRQRLAAEAQAREAAQRHATEAELRLLRAQLAPHMLFNTLANLRELIALDAKAAQSMLDDLIGFLRATLAATRSEQVTLAEEFAQLGAYLRLMARRMGPRFSWQLDLPEALARASVPPMLLQPLVENAVRHGVEPQPGPVSISVAARPDGAGIEITIVDTGRGLPDASVDAPLDAPADAHADAGAGAFDTTARRAGDPRAGAPGDQWVQHGGYGLTHVRQRLRSLYGQAASLTLEPATPHGTRATVHLPGALR
jgi:signal transduction histidine kinase